MRIPQYNPNQVPGVTSGPRKGYADPVGRAITQAGVAVTQMEEAFKQAEQVAEFSDRNSSLMQSLNDLETEFQNNPDSKVADFEERATQARQSIISEAQDHTVKRMLTESYNRAYPYKISKIKQLNREHTIDKDLAALPDRMQMYVDMAATSTSGKERAHYRTQGKLEIQLRVDKGFISAKDGERLIKDFDYRINRESVWEVASGLPYDEALKYLNKAKGLTRQDRNEFERQLEVTHKMEEARLIKEQKEAIDKTENDFFILFKAEELNFMDVVKSPLDIKRKEHWENKLLAQAKALKGDKDKDPFTITDPQVKFDAYKKINNPNGPTITTTELEDLAGKGLSTDTSLKAIEDLRAVEAKEETPEKIKRDIVTRTINGLNTQKIIGFRRWAQLKNQMDTFLRENPGATVNEVIDELGRAVEEDKVDFVTKIMDWFKGEVSDTTEPPEIIIEPEKDPDIFKGKIE